MLRGSIINWTDDKIHQSNFYVLNRKGAITSIIISYQTK